MEQKVFLVTGALGGIGKWLVKYLLRNNAKGVALVDVDDEKWPQFRDELESDSQRIIFIRADVENADQVLGMFEETVKHFNQLDVVINNAGVCDEINPERTVRINLETVVNITRLAFFKYLPKYKTADEGVIVNIASTLGLLPLHYMPTYSATKAGVIALGRCYGHKDNYERDHIRILTLCPHLTDTPLSETVMNYIPKEFGEVCSPPFTPQSPESVAKVLMYMLEHAKTGSVWVSQCDEPAVLVDCDEIDKVVLKSVKI